MRSCSVFPPLVVHMIAVGEETGAVDQMLTKVAEAYEREVDNAVDGLTALIEPLLIVFLGGIRYDIGELQLRDASGNHQHYLRVRASGTEPINRVYVESSDRQIAKTLIEEALRILEEASITQVKEAQSEWRLVDIVSQTQPGTALVEAVKQVMADTGWTVVEKLQIAMPTLENRTQKIARKWIAELS